MLPCGLHMRHMCPESVAGAHAQNQPKRQLHGEGIMLCRSRMLVPPNIQRLLVQPGSLVAPDNSFSDASRQVPPANSELRLVLVADFLRNI